MPQENVRVRKEKRRFTFVVVPSGESDKSRTFSISRWGLVASSLALFFVTVAIGFIFFAYTPVRYFLPVSNPELERRYGKEIVQIQDQVSRMMREMTILKGYNLKLRKALGENVTGQDSALAVIPLGTRIGPMSTQTGQDAQQFNGQPATGIDPRQTSTLSSVNEFGRDYGRAVKGETVGNLPLATPAEGYVTRNFDTRHYHYGTDFAGKKSSSILAAADGSVVFSGWTYNDGFMMMLAHDRGYITVYKHTEALLKSTGSVVKRGELIALLGSTGKTSSGPHLHFEVWKDGIAYDPEQFLLTTQNKQ